MRLFTVLFIAGLLLTMQWRQWPSAMQIASILAVAAMLASAGLLLQRYGKPACWQNRIGLFSNWLCSHRRSLILAISGFAIGTAICALAVMAAEHRGLAAEYISQNLNLSVVVASVPQYQGRRLRFIARVLRCHDCTGHFAPRRLMLDWYAQQPELQVGQQWRMTVRLKPPRGFRNRGSFDQRAWFLARRIDARGYVRRLPAPQLQDSDPLSINLWRQSLASRLQSLPAAGSQLPLVQAVTIGLKSGISEPTWQLLRDTGTAHLLAISGLHISLIAGWALLCGRFVGRCIETAASGFVSSSRYRLNHHALAIFLGFSAAFGYALLAGFTLPTRRALLMLLVWLVASWHYRILPVASGLLIACLVILLLDPLSPLSAGFWLSFGTVGLLCYLHYGRVRQPPARRSQERSDLSAWPACLSAGLSARHLWRCLLERAHGLRQAFRLHLLLAIVLWPVTAWFFQSASLLSPIANLIAIPWLGLLIVPPALLTVLAVSLPASIGYGAGNYLLQLTEFSIAGLLDLLHHLSQIGPASLTTAFPSIAYLLLAMAGLLCMLAPAGLRLRGFCVPMLAPIILFTVAGQRIDGVELHVLDVGQGLAAVVLTENSTLLFDTGPRSGRGGSVESVVMPYLRSIGRSQIDTLVVSHADADHAAGAADVQRLFPAVKVFASDPVLPGSQPCSAGQLWTQDDVRFAFVHPGSTDAGSENDRSCVLLVFHGRSRALLTGDIEGRGESQLSARLGDLPVDVMLAPHHGSRSSSTLPLLQTVRPRYVVFPAGNRNAYGFPHADVQMRYKLLGAHAYVTGEQGAVVFRFDKSGLRSPPQSWVDRYRRFWHAQP